MKLATTVLLVVLACASAAELRGTLESSASSAPSVQQAALHAIEEGEEKAVRHAMEEEDNQEREEAAVREIEESLLQVTTAVATDAALGQLHSAMQAASDSIVAAEAAMTADEKALLEVNGSPWCPNNNPEGGSKHSVQGAKYYGLYQGSVINDYRNVIAGNTPGWHGSGHDFTGGQVGKGTGISTCAMSKCKNNNSRFIEECNCSCKSRLQTVNNHMAPNLTCWGLRDSTFYQLTWQQVNGKCFCAIVFPWLGTPSRGFKDGGGGLRLDDVTEYRIGGNQWNKDKLRYDIGHCNEPLMGTGGDLNRHNNIGSKRYTVVPEAWCAMHDLCLLNRLSWNTEWQWDNEKWSKTADHECGTFGGVVGNGRGAKWRNGIVESLNKQRYGNCKGTVIASQLTAGSAKDKLKFALCWWCTMLG